jgi:hypothetical protein
MKIEWRDQEMNQASQTDATANSAPSNLTPELPYSSNDVLKDWAIGFQLDGAGQLNQYKGQFVVIYEGNVVGSGRDYTKLREEVAKKLSVHPERLVIFLVEPADWFPTYR